jgi:hypothetical protein
VVSAHAYAEYDIAPADAVIALPPSLDGKPFPGEPLGCAMKFFNAATFTAGSGWRLSALVLWGLS